MMEFDALTVWVYANAVAGLLVIPNVVYYYRQPYNTAFEAVGISAAGVMTNAVFGWFLWPLVAALGALAGIVWVAAAPARYYLLAHARKEAGNG
jgi:hypothetical protein